MDNYTFLHLSLVFLFFELYFGNAEDMFSMNYAIYISYVSAKIFLRYLSLAQISPCLRSSKKLVSTFFIQQIVSLQ